MRIVAVEPELSPALHEALAHGEPTPVTPRSIADGLNAPFAGRLPTEICKGIDRVLVTEEEIEERLSLPLRANETRLRAGRCCRRSRLAERKGGGPEPGARRQRRQRCQANRLCYPGPAMKADIHPEYVLATVHCGCGNTFVTRSTKPELHVEICSNCHPFYTGKQKLVDTGGRVERFQRRLEKAERVRA